MRTTRPKWRERKRGEEKNLAAGQVSVVPPLELPLFQFSCLGRTVGPRGKKKKKVQWPSRAPEEAGDHPGSSAVKIFGEPTSGEGKGIVTGEGMRPGHLNFLEYSNSMNVLARGKADERKKRRKKKQYAGPLPRIMTVLFGRRREEKKKKRPQKRRGKTVMRVCRQGNALHLSRQKPPSCAIRYETKGRKEKEGKRRRKRPQKIYTRPTVRPQNSFLLSQINNKKKKEDGRGEKEKKKSARGEEGKKKKRERPPRPRLFSSSYHPVGLKRKRKKKGKNRSKRGGKKDDPRFCIVLNPSFP